jgi:tripartite-type tricarboxylate transporter receptor subunit TctC
MRIEVVGLRAAAVGAAILSLASWQSHGWGQDSYPSRPVKVIVKAVAGGLPDTVARIVAQGLQDQLHQPFVVENRPGANGSAAIGTLSAAPPDGYTFVVTEGTDITTNVLMYRKVPYDPADVIPVALLARAPIFIAANRKVPITTMKELVDYARANPDKLNYGSSGIGSAHHLTMEAIKADLGIRITHVPFKGTGESIPALLGGHIDVGLAAYPALKGSAAGGLISLLAINSLQRSDIAPNVPPVADLIPGFDFAPTIGIFTRSGTPDAAVQKIADAVSRLSKDPETVQKFASLGIEPVGVGPREFRQSIEEAGRRISAVLKAAHIEKQ